MKCSINMKFIGIKKRYEKQINKIINSKKEILGIKENISSITISHLGMGENNLNLLITINKKYKFVFRIGLRRELKENIKKEFNLLKKIPEGLGPTPFYIDDSEKIIRTPYSILKYVEGEHIKRWTNKRLKLHAIQLTRLHNKRFSKWSGTRRFSLYNRLLNEMKGYTKKELKDKDIIKLISPVKSFIKNNDYLFTQLKSFSRAHNDLCLTNILINKNKLFYIDWEYSRIEDNAYDLAKLYFTDIAVKPWSIKLNQARENIFINHYLDNIKFKDNTLKKRIHSWHIYILFTDSLYCLWKLNNFDKENSAFSKIIYQRSLNLMINSLKKKFLENAQ